MTTIVWLRRDLRVFDNKALQTALQLGEPVLAVFIFDRNITDRLDKKDRRITFIHQTLQALRQQLADKNIPLWIAHGEPVASIMRFVTEINATTLVCAEDYEPYAIKRDEKVKSALTCKGIRFLSVCDQVIFAKSDLLTQQGKPYTVFTPYKKAWLAKLSGVHSQLMLQDNWQKCGEFEAFFARYSAYYPLPDLTTLGFIPQNNMLLGGEDYAHKYLADFLTKISHYHRERDFPAKNATSFLSVYIRFGVLSIRHLVRLALENPSDGADCWLAELIWREFYQQLLFHFPIVEQQSFKAQYRDIQWQNNLTYFEAWKKGETGYPIIDAAMRQLNQTGFMHNRLRMLVASFLCKDLLIDWRWGERYFAEKLLDYDLAANNGGWQWAASTGCDAQPYFRIFNPVTQSKKFDPNGQFIRHYLPELATLDDKVIHYPYEKSTFTGKLIAYPKPIVEHSQQRQLALLLFKRDKL